MHRSVDEDGRAMRCPEDGCRRLMGIDVDRTIATTFKLGISAGVAGVLYSCRSVSF
jgi:branched-subunit amino acid ABC-type transport system permease component